MPATRHAWLQSYHAANPFDRSLLRPLTFVDGEDLDIPWTPPSASEPKETLACSRHDFIFPYHTSQGEERIGRGRLWMPPHVETLAGPCSIPLVLSIHYEAGQEWAAGYLAQGWACMTPIALGEDHMGNLAGEGMDHTLAMAQLVRRLEWVDLQRIGWQGGSAGGYQCLMTLESLWPAACAVADVPLSDLHYNVGYLAHANRYNRGITDPAALIVPIVNAVQIITERTSAYLGGDVDLAWRNSVPVGASLIRTPTIIHSSTADLLCPVHQIGHEFVRTPKRGEFPPGWSMEYRKFCNPHSLEKPLIEWFSPEEVEQVCVGIPDTAPLVDPVPPPPNRPEQPKITPLVMTKPFSRSRLITVLIQDEGAPTPFCAHTKYVVQMDALPFFRYHFARGYVPPEHLTPILLSRVLGRFSKDMPQNPSLPPIRRLHDHFDRWEALLALETFIGNREENRRTLARVYSEMPPVARVLDVKQDDVCAAFQDDPVAGLLFHQAVVLRKNGEPKAAEAREEKLRKEHAKSAYATLKTEE